MDVVIILLISQIALSIPAFFGIFKFIKWLMLMIHIRKGGTLGRFVTPSKQEIVKQIKPSGVDVKQKLMGKDKTFKFDPAVVTFQGSIPIITYNTESMLPVDISNPKGEQDLSSEDISLLMIRAFNLGVLSALRNDKTLMLIGLVAAGAAIGAIGIGLVNGGQTNTLNGNVQTLINMTSALKGCIATTSPAVLP